MTKVHISRKARKGSRATDTLHGNLEGVQHGAVFGWIHDSSDSDKKLHVGIYEDNVLLGETIADNHREDLEEAGLGQGRCAFSMMLPDSLFDGMKHTLVAMEQETKFNLGSISCEVPFFASSSIDGIQKTRLRGQVEVASDLYSEKFAVELLVDGKVLQECISYKTDVPNVHKVALDLPTSVFDDNYHLYELRMKDRSTNANPYYARLDSLTTRWKHLGSSFANQNFSAIPKISAYRYRALQTCIRSLESGSVNVERLKQVQLAHDIVTEGMADRKHYKKISLPAVDNPDVSIIIPVYNAFDYTYNCIASLILAFNEHSFEVILVDDKSDDLTVDIEEYVENLVVVRNEENLGFLRTAEKGAAKAAGDYLVFLNNDTEVTAGWIDSLLGAFECFDNVGMAGSKLIYPDGSLQEAGGVVWGNGKPWNLGNGDNAEAPNYNYTRHADYVSGASMMVKKEVWQAVGGFSKEFIPAYYEDTDLAFKIRESGYKTLYVPSSVVIHYEGMSNGKDIDSGYKRFQAVNAPLFRKKWRHVYRNHGAYGKNTGLEVDRDMDFRVLMVDHSTPTPDQDAGSYAAIQEMRLLQELGCKITFVPNNMAHMGRYTTALQSQGIECIYAPFSGNVGEVLRDRGEEFDLIYITRYNIAEEIMECIREFTKTKVVLNIADLHFLREIRAAREDSEDEVASAMNTRSRELAVMEDVDAILSYSETEHSVISSHTFEASKIFKCPWVLNRKSQSVPFNERQGIAFLGGFNHLPNREAVFYFVNEVMPLIRKRAPEIVFNVYGSSVPEEIEALASDDVHIKGFVESLDTAFNDCRVFVAPLLSGAGIKGKVLECISYQVPCVVSPIAAESTGLVHNLNAKIPQTPAQWAEAIVSLYYDESEWGRLSASASELLDERYSVAHGLEAMSQMMSHVELDPGMRRARFFKAA